MWTDVILVLVFIFGIVYYAFRRRYTYWESRGVYGPKPSIPFGNTKDMITKREHFGEDINKIYNQYKSYPYVGIYTLHRPTLVVNDLDLCRSILTKDFIHFSDHGIPYDEEKEPLSGHLFNVGGEKWKNLRAKLTPTFTSSKMRKMFDILAECAVEMSEYLDENIKDNEFHDMKEVLAKFGNDVIANCAFGIECKSFKNPDEKFRKIGRSLFEPTLMMDISRSLNFFIPGSSYKLNIKTMGQHIEDFFCQVVEDTVNYREKNGIIRNDFMQLLIELKNTGKVSSDDGETVEEVPDDGKRLTMLQIAAQAFVFFIAGFETSSNTASFVLYELALNPDIQKKVVEEIEEISAKHNGKITYDSLAEMVYMTKVIEETLRKYPPVPIIFRQCTKKYTLPGTKIEIDKGTPTMIPIYAIQRDPDIFPDPLKFDPERFSPENKALRHHFSYLPFGEGPRICIGSRFGLMQTKLGIATLLSKYVISTCEKTLIPMRYSKVSLLISADGGVFLKLTKRTKSNNKM